MPRKTVSAVIMSLLVLGALALAFNIRPVGAIGTITIRADGSIDPSTAPIDRNGGQYILTGTIVVDDNLDGLVIERNDIVLDGAGYILQGLNTAQNPTIGIVLSDRSNITVKNLTLNNFGYNIYLNSSSNITIQGIVNSGGGYWGGPYDEGAGITLEASSNNTITECNLWGMRGGLSLVNGSSDANIISNDIINGAYVGLSISGSFNTVNQNQIGSIQYQTAFELSGSNNSVIENMVGWMSLSGANNTLVGNNIDTLFLDSSIGGNKLYHNNLPDLRLLMLSPNVWDDGYPSGGNHWSNYNGVDLYSGPYQNESGSDGIGDTPYLIAPGNRDNYPLMNPYYKFDTAVNEIRPSNTTVDRGLPLIINVTVTELGASTVTFNLTINATHVDIPNQLPIMLQANAASGWNNTIPGPTISATQGDTILLTILATDTLHHLFFVDYRNNSIPEYGDPQTGPFMSTNVTLTFTAEAGNFTYYDADNENTMFGTMTVQAHTPQTLQIGSQNVTLATKQQENVTFFWNTSGIPYGNYTLSAYAEPVPGETAISNNNFAGGWVVVSASVPEFSLPTILLSLVIVTLSTFALTRKRRMLKTRAKRV